MTIAHEAYRITEHKAPETCKCCGQPLPNNAKLFMEARTYTALRHGKLATLTRLQFLALQAVANAAQPVSAMYIMAKLYEDRADGGADSIKVVDVVVSKLNKKLIPLRVKIRTTNRGPGARRFLDYQ